MCLLQIRRRMENLAKSWELVPLDSLGRQAYVLLYLEPHSGVSIEN